VTNPIADCSTPGLLVPSRLYISPTLRERSHLLDRTIFNHRLQLTDLKLSRI
jgi:hypothetical protein